MKHIKLTIQIFLFLNICISTSNAQVWEKMNFKDSLEITCFAVDSSNRLWSGSNIGLSYYDTMSRKWRFSSSDTSYILNTKVIKRKSDPFFSLYFISKNIETNFCDMWEYFGGGYQAYGENGYFTLTSMSIDNDSTIICSAIGDTTNAGVLRGYYWKAYNSGLPIVKDSIYGLDIANKNDTLYVGLKNGLYYSIDNGDSWHPVSFFDGLEVHEFVLNSKNDLYFIVSGTNEKSGLYKNFVKIYNDVLPLVAVGVNRNDDVFIASNTKGKGVFWTNDNGTVWQEMYHGLDSCEITELICDIDGFIYAGTYWQGIYKSLKSTTKIENVIIHNISAIPNPFSELAKITFNLDNPSYTKITIYNALGNIIEVLGEDYLEDGYHEYTFDGSPLPSGTYFYVLQSAGKVETGKLVLIK